MGEKVLLAIVKEVLSAKYYSISVDSTPDVSHVDQLTFTVRYVKDSDPVERFLQFIPVHSHGAENLADVVIEFLQRNGIPLSDCRGQTYDNASNMAGRYSGLQARLRAVNPVAVFVPCAGHSLKLVGVKAAECCVYAVSFFEFVRKLYSFFSASTHRWAILTASISQHCSVVKRLSDTVTPDGRLMRMRLRLCVKAMRTSSLHLTPWRVMSISQKTHGLKDRVSVRKWTNWRL